MAYQVDCKKISVIIPVYNAEIFLEKCIESVIYQTYKNLEIILIDDGSTDKSGKICDKYAKLDKRIIVSHKENSGASAARNEGMKIASGDYFGFVDSDDYIDKEMYKTLYRISVLYDADIAVCGCKQVTPAGKTLKLSKLKNEIISGNINCSLYFAQKKTYSYLCNKLYKKELFHNIELPYLHFSEDRVANCEIFYKCNILAIINDAFYNYVVNPFSTCNAKFTIKNFDILKGDIWIYDFNMKNTPQLADYAILDILSDIAQLYSRLQKTEIEDKKKYEKLFLENFNQFFSKLKYGKAWKESSLQRKLLINLFHISPKLCYLFYTIWEYVKITEKKLK